MEPLKIGNIVLPHRAVFGPMAGFTDAPCRRLMAQHGAGFTVSEMVSSRALVYGDHKTVSLLKAAPNGAPYGVQIFGEVPQIMGEATAAMEQYEFDFVDINMGCPAPKIVSGGAGSKLMLDPDRCGRIVEQVVAHTSRPVTVKMRKGWDADHVTAVECAKACEQAGAALIAVHARTREQMYTPGIDPEIIARVKQAVHVPVLGNGDIHSAEDAVAMMQQTGCDGVMIARAALGDPWLFERVNAAIEGTPEPKAPNLQARMNALRRQVMQTFDAAWDRLPTEDRTQWPYTPEAQKDFRWKQLISVSQPDQLDDLPLLLDTEGSAGVLVRVYYADTRQYRNTRFDLPLDAVAVPADWQQRVLGQWTVYRIEVEEDVSYPEESGEQYTLKLEAGDSPDTVRATLTRISKYGDTTAETRTGVLTRGSIGFAFEGECWQLRCQRADDKNYEWAIALREDGTMTMADMGGNAEYSYISWMDLRRS